MSQHPSCPLKQSIAPTPWVSHGQLEGHKCSGAGMHPDYMVHLSDVSGLPWGIFVSFSCPILTWKDSSLTLTTSSTSPNGS